MAEKDPNLLELERKVSDQFGAKVQFDSDLNAKSGWLKIRYFDHETLSGLLEKMGVGDKV